jgi:hypothetical protein
MIATPDDMHQATVPSEAEVQEVKRPLLQPPLPGYPAAEAEMKLTDVAEEVGCEGTRAGGRSETAVADADADADAAGCRGPSCSSSGGVPSAANDEEEGECRICGDCCPVSELTEPCDCRGGMRYAHHECVQLWISTEKMPGKQSDTCEICGSAWKGARAFDIPRARELPSPEESMRRVHLLLSASYVRVVMDIPRPNDLHILRTLGPHVPGPWHEHLRREEAKKRSIFTKMKRGLGSFFSSSRGNRGHASVGGDAGGGGGAAGGDGERGWTDGGGSIVAGPNAPAATGVTAAEALQLQMEALGSSETASGGAGAGAGAEGSVNSPERLERPPNPGCFPAFRSRR